MIHQKNILLEGAAGRPFLLDLYAPATNGPHPVVIFVHGFKGFKDWGHWERIAQEFVEAGFAFVKFNLSHNGTTLENPLAFDDLEAFGNNNYSKELKDIDVVLNYLLDLSTPNLPFDFKANNQKVYLIGHSRGGAISIVKSALDARITGLITWAAVSTLDYAWKDAYQMQSWKEKGVMYILNRRTHQEMPLYYQFYEDYLENFGGKEVPDLLETFDKPILILHGSDDPVITLEAAQSLKKWTPHAKLEIIDGADHVFGGQHPFTGEKLANPAQALVDNSIRFLLGQ